MLAGTVNEDPNIPEFNQRFSPTFPVGEADKDAAFKYLQLDTTKRLFVPFMVFIDRSGMIRSQYTGTDKIMDESDSDKLLREEALKYLDEATKPAKAKPGSAKR